LAMTFDPSNPGAVHEVLLTLHYPDGPLPTDLVVEGPLHTRANVPKGPKPMPAAHPRTLIYKCRSALLPHPLALKVFDLASASNAGDWIRGEAEVLIRLQSSAEAANGQPLASRFYAADAGRGLLVSEWIPGGDLRSWLMTYGRLPGARSRGVAAAGRWLAAYHKTVGAAAGRASPAVELAIVHKVLNATGTEVSGLAPIVHCLDSTAGSLDGFPCLVAPRHGDFSPNNLLMPGEGAALRAIDFSLPILAPVAQDVAQFMINRSVRLATDLHGRENASRPWQDAAAYRAFAEGYGKGMQTAFPAQLLSFYGLVWCVRRIIGLSVTSVQKNRAWHDRVDRRMELKRHHHLARIFAAHLNQR